MQNDNLKNHIDFLLPAALQKCGDIYDAEDLAQETMLAALSYMAKGKEIKDMRAWLLTVLSYKWNDLLRKKYSQPTVGIGEGFDIADESDDIASIYQTDDAELVRKNIAFLARNYREVIVRHYMNGESVASIAASLGVPEGTVKSRLHGGRMKIKKGFESMENYSKQSYSPVRLHISNSGVNGRNNEPQSLVNGDLLAQNILWAAYERPLTAEEIGLSLGTPTAYIEPIIQKLLDGELMNKVSDRYYTDFIIYTNEDKEKYIPMQKEFVKNNFDLFWNSIDGGLARLRGEDFYSRLGFDEKNSLEMYFAFNCLDYGIYFALCDIFKQNQEFPYRKDGGRWIAFGGVYFGKFDPSQHPDLMAHLYSGERHTIFDKYAGKSVRQHVYSADGFPNYSYYDSPDYDFLKESDDIDEIVTKLLFILHMGIPTDMVGLNTEYLKAIPHLTRCRILREENGKPRVNIPVLNGNEFVSLCNILTDAKREMCGCGELVSKLAEFIKDKKTSYPSHIGSISLFKQYMYATNAMLFACVRQAISRGRLYDGHYDDDSHGINQHPCPMFLVIE